MELWVNRIRECKASKQTVSDWCSSHGIHTKTYYYWMRKIKKEAFDSLPELRKPRAASSSTELSFAEISIPESKQSDASVIRIHLSDLVLEIPSGMDGTTIESTIRAIRNLC